MSVPKVGLRDVVKLFKEPGIVIEDSGMVVVVTLQKDLKKMSATQVTWAKRSVSKCIELFWP